MKNLKVKSILFSLMAVLMVSVFMTSCEQELGVETLQEDYTETSITSSPEEITFMLPYGYSNLSDAEQNEYISKLSNEDFEELTTNRKVILYFISLGKEEVLMNNASYGDIFNESTVINHLSTAESQKFQAFNINETVESRWCDAYEYLGIHRAIYRGCYDYHRSERDCTRWWEKELKLELACYCCTPYYDLYSCYGCW